MNDRTPASDQGCGGLIVFDMEIGNGFTSGYGEPDRGCSGLAFL